MAELSGKSNDALQPVQVQRKARAMDLEGALKTARDTVVP
jgi:hypothetical protein